MLSLNATVDSDMELALRLSNQENRSNVGNVPATQNQAKSKNRGTKIKLPDDFLRVISRQSAICSYLF